MAKRISEKREVEDTQELSIEEVIKAEKKLNVPYQDYEDDDEETLSKPMLVAIVAIISIVGILIIFVCLSIFTTSNTDTNTTTEPIATATTEATEQTTELDYYYKQAVLTAITTQLDEDYDVDGYTRPSSEQIKITGTQNAPTATFQLTVGDAYKKNYVMPAEFQLEWDDEGKYEIVSYTVDDSEAVKSGFKAHTSKKQAEKATANATTEGSEVSNFEVTVRNSVTVTITGKGSGTVTAYAISEEGNTTELASTSGGTVTKTVDLPSGQYKLVLYATEDAGYSWNYQLG